jgi:hypothetical protein
VITFCHAALSLAGEWKLARKLPNSPSHQRDYHQGDQERTQSLRINRRTAASLHNSTTTAKLLGLIRLLGLLRPAAEYVRYPSRST